MTDIVDRLNDSLSAGYSELRKEAAAEITRLRARIEAMEQQEPVAWCATDETGTVIEALGMNQSRRFDAALYLAPGAQPALIIPEGWLRAIDEALVVAHIGVANESDTYEQAKAKLDSLISFHVDVTTDPAVNGGWKLVPTNPTETFYQCFSAYDGTSYSNPFDYDDFVKDWRAALESATEAKP